MKKRHILAVISIHILVVTTILSLLFNNESKFDVYADEIEQKEVEIEKIEYDEIEDNVFLQNDDGNIIQKLSYCTDNAILNNDLENNIINNLEKDAEIAKLNCKETLEEKQKILEEEEQRKQELILDYTNLDIDEEYLLSAIIYCEAGNQSYDGKVAVGNVVLNRVESEKFPDTITEVIFQNGQFSPTENGALKKALEAEEIQEESVEAARDALNGYNVVGDCLYFHRTKGHDNGYILGDHVFY